MEQSLAKLLADRVYGELTEEQKKNMIVKAFEKEIEMVYQNQVAEQIEPIVKLEIKKQLGTEHYRKQISEAVHKELLDELNDLSWIRKLLRKGTLRSLAKEILEEV